MTELASRATATSTSATVGEGPAVVVIGDVMTDVAISGDDLAHTLAHGSDTPATIVVGGGGAGGNVAAWLAHLRVSVGLVCAVGDDGAGRLAVDDLRRAGVAVRAAIAASQSTGTVVALAGPDGERTMITDRGANASLPPDDLPRRWFRRGAHLHLSGYTLFTAPARDAALTALALARSHDMTVSVDPASWAPLRSIGSQRFLDWTTSAGLCLPNADEARLLADAIDVNVAARRLGARYGRAVVTLGASGAVSSDGVDLLRAPAEPCDRTDGLGAGDAFTAGYLAAYTRGESPVGALHAAISVAALALGQPGARPG